MNKYIALVVAMFVGLLTLTLVMPTAAVAEDVCVPTQADISDWLPENVPPGDGWYLIDTRVVEDIAAWDEPVVITEAYDELVHHEAITHIVHHEAVTHVVHHEAITHEETVVDSPAIWANWAPNETRGPQDYVPIWPHDPRGTWIIHNQLPPGHEGPDGVYQKGGGNSPWFYRQAAVTHVEIIIDEPAWDETVIDAESYDEVVVDTEAWDEIIHHPEVTGIVHHDAITHDEYLFAINEVTCEPDTDPIEVTPVWQILFGCEDGIPWYEIIADDTEAYDASWTIVRGRLVIFTFVANEGYVFAEGDYVVSEDGKTATATGFITIPKCVHPEPEPDPEPPVDPEDPIKPDKPNKPNKTVDHDPNPQSPNTLPNAGGEDYWAHMGLAMLLILAGILLRKRA